MSKRKAEQAKESQNKKVKVASEIDYLRNKWSDPVYGNYLNFWLFVVHYLRESNGVGIHPAGKLEHMMVKYGYVAMTKIKRLEFCEFGESKAPNWQGSLTQPYFAVRNPELLDGKFALSPP